MCGILMTFTRCSSLDHEPKPSDFKERWLLTYHNYRGLKYGSHTWSSVIPVPEEYQNLSRDLTVSRDGSKVYIKGMFPEYPDAYVTGMMDEDKLVFEPTQRLGGAGGEKLYFHCGLARQEFPGDKHSDKDHGNNIIIQISFNPDTSPNKRPSFSIWENSKDRNLHSGETSAYSFWLSKDKEGLTKFYTQWNNGQIEGTGFPDEPNYMIGMRFQSVSGTGEPEAN